MIINQVKKPLRVILTCWQGIRLPRPVTDSILTQNSSLLASLITILCKVWNLGTRERWWEIEVEFKNSVELMISYGTNVFWFILGHGVFLLSSSVTPVVNIWLHMGMHARYEVIVCKNLESASTDQRYILAVSIPNNIK